jgi:DNA-binding MarR family transcriptional regulator
MHGFRHHASLTPRGKALLEHMQGPVRRAHDRTIEALEPEARAVFMASLGTLTDAGRARLRGK